MNSDHDTIPAGHSMTIEILQADIAFAKEQFHKLNRLHWVHGTQHAVSGRWFLEYRGLKPATERRINELAMRIERLNKFCVHLAAKRIIERIINV